MADKFIEIDGSELLRIAEALKESPKEIRLAVAHAANETAKSVRTKVGKEVNAEYAIKQRDIKKTIKIRRAKVNSATAEVISEGERIPLHYFKHSPKNEKRTRYGVKAQVKREGGLKVIKPNSAGNKAFKVKIHDSSMIFIRKGEKRIPIKKLHTLSVPQMISDINGKSPVIKRIQLHTQKELAKKVDQEINYRLDKIAKEAGEKK